MSEQEKWYKSPQGIVSVATIFTLVVGFFWVREKQMWEASARIAAVELRGSTAIAQAGNRLERVEEVLSSIRDQVNFLERKIDRLEIVAAEAEGRRNKSYENAVPGQ